MDKQIIQNIKSNKIALAASVFALLTFLSGAVYSTLGPVIPKESFVEEKKEELKNAVKGFLNIQQEEEQAPAIHPDKAIQIGIIILGVIAILLSGVVQITSGEKYGGFMFGTSVIALIGLGLGVPSIQVFILATAIVLLMLYFFSQGVF